MFHQQMDGVAVTKKTHQWLEKAALKDSMEALIITSGADCAKNPQRQVQHITAGCKTLVCKAYMERQNHVAGIVYWSTKTWTRSPRIKNDNFKGS